MTKLVMPPADYLREILSYDQNTGLLFWNSRPREWFTAGYNAGETSWRTWNTQNAGKQAGAPRRDGYIRVCINGQRFMAHRIIWTMQTNETPDEIDHINGDRADNRWCNLRSVNRTENMRNLSARSDNTSGYTGVSFAKRDGVFISTIFVDGKTKVIGRFATAEEALNARKAEERRLNFHINHGRKNLHSDHPKST